MKKIIIITLISFCICTAFVVKKPVRNMLLTDYRDNYVGTYACVYKSYFLKPNEPFGKQSGSLNLSVSKDAIDSIMIITIGNNQSKYKLKNSWLYSYPDDNKHKGGRFFGGDSISLYQTNMGSGIKYLGKKN